MIAFPPALFFSDSWGYLFTAFTGHPVSLSYLRPNGYSVIVRLLTFPGRDLQQLVAIQHLSGLLVGALVYVVLVRAEVPRLAALAASALVLLDGYRITLEQYVMPDSLFTLTVILSAVVLAWPRLTASRNPLASSRKAQGEAVSAAIAGLLLGISVIQREAALFAAPAFLAYLIWARIGLRGAAGFLLALAIPVVGYAAVYQARVGVFGLTESNGWTLYGRVGGFASCSGAGIPASQRPLCETGRARAAHTDAPTWYIWDGSSPAARMFHGGHQNRHIQEHANRLLANFADRIIVHQPLAYLDATFSDALRYFTPGATPFNDAVSATSLPARAADEARSERVRRRVLPGLHPRVAPPSGLVRDYRRIVHLPRPVLALLAIVSLVGLVLPVAARREVLLLTGSGLLMILGTAATAGFGLRYVLPAVPLLAVGGTLAAVQLPVPRMLRHPRVIGSPGG